MAVLVPLNFAVAVGDLDESHAPFQKTASHQTLATKVFRDRIVDAVHPLGRLGFPRQVLDLGHRGLHAVGQFKRVQPSIQ